MNWKAILLIAVLVCLLPFVGCNHEQKKNQPPTEADQERIEKEYQQNLDKLHDLTSGTKEPLDGKRVPQATSTPRK